MSKTKIVVLHLKEIIYTALFAGLGVLLIILLIFMFLKKGDDSTATMASELYIPGVWTSTIVLNDTSLNLEVVVDKDHINSIRIVNIDETISTFYPLVESSLDKIAEELYNGSDIDSIELSEDSKYTQTLLIDAIKMTLAKATPVAEKN
ncbi:MAG: hypothetical protein K0S61_3489 [Anaerocolumna sp.]|nr:hypothetical protein [Anaerocolumna sp.]